MKSNLYNLITLIALLAFCFGIPLLAPGWFVDATEIFLLSAVLLLMSTHMMKNEDR